MEDPAMPEAQNPSQQESHTPHGRRSFLFAALGGAVAAVAGWIAGAFPRAPAASPASTPSPFASLTSTPSPSPSPTSTPSPSISTEDRIAALEAEVAQLTSQLPAASSNQAIAQLEGERNERVVFNKSELTVTNSEGVLLNLVATNGHVGIRFYKDFGFGNEQVTNPWHMGFIEGARGYQGLAILRDWRFTAALWGEDGRLLLGSLDPHPPANEPARARVNVRGTLDEVQAMIEASPTQTADILQVVGRDGNPSLAVDSVGNVMIGSSQDPRPLVLHDTQGGTAYTLKVTNGQLALGRA